MAKTCNKEDCNNPRFGGGFCSWHQYLRTDKKLKRLKPRSAKMQEKDDKYYPKKDEFLEKHPKCQIRKPGVCTRDATQVHHSEYRTGDGYLDEDTWFATCFECHRYVHLNPAESRKKGWLK